jgi:hypothetical protein
LTQKENECLILIKEVRFKKELPDKLKEGLSKRSNKAITSTLYGCTNASKNFQRTRNWSRTEKGIKNLDRSPGEKNLEHKEVDDLYSFKTLLRMLYQSGLVILRKVSSVASITYLSFPSSWIQFRG